MVSICFLISSLINYFWNRISFLRKSRINPFRILRRVFSSNSSFTAYTADFVFLNVLPWCLTSAFCLAPPIGTGPPPPPKFFLLLGGRGYHDLFSSWASLSINSLISSLRYSCIASFSINLDSIIIIGVTAVREYLTSSI